MLQIERLRARNTSIRGPQPAWSTETVALGLRQGSLIVTMLVNSSIVKDNSLNVPGPAQEPGGAVLSF